jgi:hypothetical protein
MGIESNNNSLELFKWILRRKLPLLKQFLKQDYFKKSNDAHECMLVLSLKFRDVTD